MALRECGNQFGDSRVEFRQVEAVHVVALAHQAQCVIHQVLPVHGQGTSAKLSGAVANEVAIVFHWVRGATELPQGPVGGVRQIGQRVGQCPIEVEENGAEIVFHEDILLKQAARGDFFVVVTAARLLRSESSTKENKT